MNKRKAIFGIIGLSATILGFIANVLYSDFIYSNNIKDFGLADALPGFLYVIGFSQLLLIKPPIRPGFVIGVVVLASSLLELMNYPDRMLDYKNIIASIAGGFISFAIWKYVDKKIRKSHKIKM